MTILAFITDLFFQAKVGETAKQLGANLQIVTSLYKFIPALQKGPTMVVIDLEAEGISGSALISQVKNTNGQIPVLAFATHKRADLLESAQRAGADEALPRSKFSKQLPKLIDKYSKALEDEA